MVSVNQNQHNQGQSQPDLYVQFPQQSFLPIHHHIPQQSRPSNSHRTDPEDLTPEEVARRERVRAAARERQRKHRALIKERKMQALGLDMGNEAIPTQMGEGELQLGVDGQGPQLQQQQFHQLSQQQPHMVYQSALNTDPERIPANVQAASPGQMFATTLLLSFSCAPLLKEHLLNNLQMTDQELASLEPLIAEAWEQWDRQRRQQYVQPPPLNTAASPSEAFTPDTASSTTASTPTSTTGEPSNEFRARFRKPVLAPSPFQAQSPVDDSVIDPALSQGQGLKLEES